MGPTYVFGGTDSANPPVPDAAGITSSPFYTLIGAAVTGLAANGAAATTAATLAVASSDAPGTTPFSGPPGQAPTLDLGAGAPVQVGLLANANTLAVFGRHGNDRLVHPRYPSQLGDGGQSVE